MAYDLYSAPKHIPQPPAGCSWGVKKKKRGKHQTSKMASNKNNCKIRDSGGGMRHA